jgi:hypothetical protein
MWYAITLIGAVILTALVVRSCCRTSATIGLARWVPNRERKFGQALSYGIVIVRVEGQAEERWVFTPHERENMLKRAEANPEDN